MIVKKIDVWSLARIQGALTAGFGLLVGILFSLISLAGASLAGPDSDVPAGLGVLFGAGAIVFFPILYGVIGIVVGAITALLYNLFAGMVGGIRLEVE